jgi:flavodoxin
MKSLIILFSYHHKNTEKVAKVFAEVLNAEIKTSNQVNLNDLEKYDLIGFGAGIDSGRHHKPLLDLADKLPQANNKKAFIFSTCGNPFNEQTYKQKCHSALREKLQAKNYQILDEFICKGFNTNVFLKYLGGINKGHPNEEDLKRAKEFAGNLKKRFSLAANPFPVNKL